MTLQQRKFFAGFIAERFERLTKLKKLTPFVLQAFAAYEYEYAVTILVSEEKNLFPRRRVIRPKS